MSISDKFAKAKEVDLFAELSEEEKLQADLQASIAMRIRRKRAELEMTQAQFAEHLDVAQAMISKWESGSYNFTLSALAKLFAKLEESLSFDFDRKEPQRLAEHVTASDTASWKKSATSENRWSKRTVAAEAFTV